MFQKDGVRAGPSAPESPQKGGKEEERKARSGDCKKEHPEVLWCEGEAEEVKFTLGDIQKNSRSFIDGDPREDHVDGEKKKCENPSGKHEGAGDICGVQNVVGPVIIDGGDSVEIGSLGNAHGETLVQMEGICCACIVENYADGEAEIQNTAFLSQQAVCEKDAQIGG